MHYSVFYLGMIVNFMYELDWVRGCPGTWVNVILGAVRVFLDEINI